MTQRESLRQGKGGNKPVTEKDNEGETVSQLVRTGGWARRRRLRTICPRASAMVRSSASGASFCCAVSYFVLLIN